MRLGVSQLCRKSQLGTLCKATFTLGSWSRLLPLKPRMPWRMVVGLMAPLRRDASALLCIVTKAHWIGSMSCSTELNV